MLEESLQPNIPGPEIDNIISDLEVLSEKCKRDIANKFYWSTIYYCSEFNRILAQVKQIYPGRFEDVCDIVIDTDALGEIRGGSVTANAISYLHEVDAEISKVYARIRGEKGKYRGKAETLLTLERVCDRFDQVARQLRDRHNSRQTIDISDEYDVQDLIHALLKIHFDDIRAEEWTPSYAGSSSRMDLLLKPEQVVVEVKRVSDKLRDREVGKQLIVDIAQYNQHPDCRTLVCFVYDPEGKIGNPTGLENDLSKLSSSDLDVRVFVRPR